MEQVVIRKRRKIYSVIRFILITAIACNLVACFLVLGHNIWKYDTLEVFDLFVWYSVIGGIYATLLSAFVLISASIKYMKRHKPVWSTFRVEYMLVLGALACLTALRFCIVATI